MNICNQVKPSNKKKAYRKGYNIALLQGLKGFYIDSGNRNLTKLHSLVTLCNTYQQRVHIQEKKTTIKIDIKRVCGGYKK